MKRIFLFLIVACLFSVCRNYPIAQTLNAAESDRYEMDPSRIKVPRKAQPILPVDEVKVGMRGYGMTVFHGTKIEPFSFEVVSIEYSHQPARSVIWVRCDGPRMQKTGPVSGMSGSPMYIWPKGAQQVLGQNGLLIGAFAYGYRLSKDCYAGVQPIEQMRDVATRIGGKRKQKIARSNSAVTATRLKQIMRGMNLSQDWRIHSLIQLQSTIKKPEERENTAGVQVISAENPTISDVSSVKQERDPRQLLLPVSGLDPLTTEIFNPLFESQGLLPVSTQGRQNIIRGGPSPFDMSKTKLEPGSIISVPLAFGDSDLSAAGTVTDVLPDGTVLAFGHAMDNIGDSRLPVATGFVHFIQPQLTNSFKMAGSGTLTGTLLRDEQSAIAIRAQKKYSYAPMDVTIQYQREPKLKHHYKLAMDPGYTAMLAGAVTNSSITAYRGLAPDTTVDCDVSLEFTEDKSLKFSRRFAGRDTRPISGSITSVITAAMNNGFQDLLLKKASVNLKVKPKLQLASITEARLEHTRVKPGEMLAVRIALKPFQMDTVEKRLTLKVPEDTKPGVYRVSILDGNGYNQWVGANQPHRRSAEDLNSYWRAISEIFSVPADELYLVMETKKAHLTIGQNELPDLPLAKQRLFASGHTTLATSYRTWIEKAHPMPWVVQGGISYTIIVEENKHPDQD